MNVTISRETLEKVLQKKGNVLKDVPIRISDNMKESNYYRYGMVETILCLTEDTWSDHVLFWGVYKLANAHPKSREVKVEKGSYHTIWLCDLVYQGTLDSSFGESKEVFIVHPKSKIK